MADTAEVSDAAGPGDGSPAPDLAAWWRTNRFALVTFAAVASVVLLDVVLSYRHLDRVAIPTPDGRSFPGRSWLGGLAQTDAVWYDEIARTGYRYDGSGVGVYGPLAFFPAYPLAMRVLGWVVGDPTLAGILLTFVCGAGATLLLHQWALPRIGARAARFTVLSFVLFPFGYYLYGAVYVQAFVIFLTIGAFLLVERGHPILAGLLGIVVTAARPEGVIVAIGLVAVTVHQRRAQNEPLRPADGGVLLSFVGVAAWIGYVGARFGDPLLFAKVQGAWGNKPGPDTWFKGDFFRRVPDVPGWVSDVVAGSAVHDPHPWMRLTFFAGLVLQAAIMIGALALTVGVFRRFGWGYGVFALVTILFVSAGTDDFAAIGRYVMIAFPCFAMLGVVLAEHRWAARTWLPVSTALLVLIASALARGQFLA